MNTNDILTRAADTIDATTVFAPAYHENGVTVIPAAAVRGGGGVGSGTGDDGESGEGGGFGLAARPAGLIVIDGSTVIWKRPPVDLTRVILGGQLVAVAYLFFAWLTARSRAKS